MFCQSTNRLIVAAQVVFNALQYEKRSVELTGPGRVILLLFCSCIICQKKGCSFVMATKSTCLKSHAVAPSCFRRSCVVFCPTE